MIIYGKCLKILINSILILLISYYRFLIFSIFNYKCMTFILLLIFILPKLQQYLDNYIGFEFNAIKEHKK